MQMFYISGSHCLALMVHVGGKLEAGAAPGAECRRSDNRTQASLPVSQPLDQTPAQDLLVFFVSSMLLFTGGTIARKTTLKF